MFKSYSLKASFILAGITADSPPSTLFLVQVVTIFSVSRSSFHPRNGEKQWLAHFIKFLFLNNESILIPDGFNTIPASPPLSFLKLRLNLGDGTG